MAPNVDLVTVTVSVNGNKQTIKMERGTSFENKGGIFTAGESNGVLQMTNYQARTFLAMANNSWIDDNEKKIYDEISKKKDKEIDLTGAILTKEDIQKAQKKYRNGEFVTDMSEFLPEGYRIEKPKLTSAENMVQAYVTNGKETQSATLKFSFMDLFNNQSQKSSAQEDITVVKGKDLRNNPSEYFSLENRELVSSREAKTCSYARLPYVENGVVKLEDEDADILCTYKDGVLLKYERTVTERVNGRGNYNCVLQKPGDFQCIEFYDNGKVKSLDIKIDQYEKFVGGRFTCKFDRNGSYLSGKEEVLRQDWDGKYRYFMINMSEETYEDYADRLPILYNFED